VSAVPERLPFCHADRARPADGTGDDGSDGGGDGGDGGDG
jgi:hypothetical protein